MITGFISLILASLTVIAMILMSADKLKAPFRRLIFGLGASDPTSSIASVFQSLIVAAEGMLAYRIQGTCEAVAFPVFFGFNASQLYTLSVCIYYLHVIRYNTRDRDFAKRIEPWLHCISSIAYRLLRILNLQPVAE